MISEHGDAQLLLLVLSILLYFDLLFSSPFGIGCYRPKTFKESWDADFLSRLDNNELLFIASMFWVVFFEDVKLSLGTSNKVWLSQSDPASYA